MRIGFDVSQTGSGKAGCGFYAEGMLRALTSLDRTNEYILYPTFGDHFYDPQISCDHLAMEGKVRIGPHHTHAQAKKFWSRPAATFESELGNPDVVHANNFFAPRALAHARLVFTLYDLIFLDNWRWTTEANRIGCFDGLFGASVSADWIVAISRYTRERFIQTFPHFPAERVTVIYPASRFGETHPEKRPQSADLERRKFWLSVGTLEPRKNHRAILLAYRELRKRWGPKTYPLVIVGGGGWMIDVDAEIRTLDLNGSVRLIGYVEDSVLCWLYRNTTGLVFPSLYEGFGMPVLEAMSCGSPVIAASNSSFPEILPDQDFSELLPDPLNPDSVADAMGSLQNMSPKDLDMLGAKAKTRARQFSWERSAQSLLDVYRKAVSTPKLFEKAGALITQG